MNNIIIRRLKKNFFFSGVQADAHGQLVGAQAEVHGRAAQRDDGFARFSKLLRLVSNSTYS